MKIFRPIAFALALWPALAAAQVPNFPQTLPPNTVVGRLGVGPGPSQAIPFSVLNSQIRSTFRAATIFGNPAAETAFGSDFTLTSLPSRGTPDLSNDLLVILNSATGALNKVAPSTLITTPSVNRATISGNPTTSTATRQDFTIQDLPDRSSPDLTNDRLMLWNSATNEINSVAPSSIISAGSIFSMASYSTGGTSDDTTGVQAAFTACTAVGCQIVCPTGVVYTINTITVGPNTKVSGCNFQQRVTSAKMFTVTSGVNVSFVGNSFTGNSVTTGLASPIANDTPIWVVDSDGINISDNKFYKFGLYESYFKNSTNITLKNNRDNSVAFGPRFFCSAYVLIDGNIYNHTSLYSTTPTLDQVAIGPMLDSDACGPSSFVKMVNNTVIDYPYSQAYQVHSGNYVTISNNTAKNASICVGINAYASYDSISRINVSGNVCESGTGITLPTDSDIGITALWNGTTAKPFWITITGNTLIGFNNLDPTAGDGCITADTASYLTVTGNTLENCGANGISLFGNTIGAVISGNSISDIVTVGSTSNGVLLATGISGGGIMSGNMFTSMSNNISNPSTPSGFKFTSLNNCVSVTTCI